MHKHPLKQENIQKETHQNWDGWRRKSENQDGNQPQPEVRHPKYQKYINRDVLKDNL